SIWTICAELALSLTKPCFLTPGVSGFVLGPLGKIGNSRMSCYFILADCLFVFFTIIGMTMSLTYRYTNIFPGTVKTIGTSKWMIVTCLIIQLAISILLCIIADKFFSLDHDTMARKAIEFSPALSKFTNEPSFVFVELALSLTKPCFLMPGAGGFVLGPLGKIGNSTMSCYFILADCLFVLFTIIGMTMSLVYRYTSIFPGIVKTIGTSKWMMFTCLLLQSIIGILICMIAGKFFSLDRDTMVRMAIEFSPVLSRFVNELTFALIDKNFMLPMVFVACITLTVLSVLFIILTVALIIELKNYKYAMNNFKLQKALILSCVVQIGITFIFLFIPVMVFFYCLTYGTIYAGPITMIAVCILSLHALIEMLATVCFVLPYRRYVKSVFGSNQIKVLRFISILHSST
ncbi:hypothetical protein FO519_009860, partial [Halicephalobus sp. NKZ332]